MTIIKWNGENIDKLLDLHAKGLTCNEIGKRFGCTRNAIDNKLRKLGKEINREYEKKEIECFDIKVDYTTEVVAEKQSVDMIDILLKLMRFGMDIGTIVNYEVTDGTLDKFAIVMVEVKGEEYELSFRPR